MNKLWKCYIKGRHKKSVYDGVCIRCGRDTRRKGEGFDVYSFMVKTAKAGLVANALVSVVLFVLIALGIVHISF